jgi:hypothetical protein
MAGISANSGMDAIVMIVDICLGYVVMNVMRQGWYEL